MMFFRLFTPTILFVVPFAANAVESPRNFKELVGLLIGIIDVLIIALSVLMFLVFIWGIGKAWIINAGDEESIKSGKRLVVIGVLTLAVLSGIWGILAILRYTLFGQV